MIEIDEQDVFSVEQVAEKVTEMNNIVERIQRRSRVQKIVEAEGMKFVSATFANRESNPQDTCYLHDVLIDFTQMKELIVNQLDREQAVDLARLRNLLNDVRTGDIL